MSVTNRISHWPSPPSETAETRAGGCAVARPAPDNAYGLVARWARRPWDSDWSNGERGWSGRKVGRPSDSRRSWTWRRLPRPISPTSPDGPCCVTSYPRPSWNWGAWLSGVSTGGAIDVSDGLALDLHRLAEASGVGIRLESEALPTSRGSRALCRHLELDPLELSLTGGEDYVLLFTLPNDIAPPPHFGARAIGRVDTGSGPRIVDAEGEHPLPAMGWDHLREARNTERLGDDRR